MSTSRPSHKPILAASLPATLPPVPLLARPSQMRLLAIGLLFFAVVFNLYYLYPEVASQTPMLNDGVLHLLALEQMADSIAVGQNPTDSWLGTISLGYPLFHYYQHLAYLPPAIWYYLSGGALSLSDLLHWTQYLLLSLFPLSIYGSMRRFGFAHLPAGLAGLLAPLLATNGLFGFDYGSYVWVGSGLYTQLWGMFLLPLALAQGYLTLRTGQGYAWATLLVAATLLAHLIFGYIALLSLGLFVGLGAFEHQPGNPARELWRRGWRLGLLSTLVVLVAAYFLIPFWLDKAYMNRSIWEEASKYDSYGHVWILGALLRGEIFDFGRFPALTLLGGMGLLRCLWRWREERYRLPVALALFWLLLYFGRPTWGPLLDFLPLSRDLHFHRLIAGVHLGGIYLMGLGLALPWQWALARSKPAYLLGVAVLTTLLLYPVYAERGAYLVQNRHWLTANQTALMAEEQDITALVTTLQQVPPGRVYAGLGNNWGQSYSIGDVPVYALLNEAGLDTLGYLYHALSLNADIQVLFDESRPEHYNLFNVRYVVAPVDYQFPNFVRPMQRFGRHQLYEVTTSGYFDLVRTDIAFTGDKQDFYPAAATWLNSPLLPAKQHPALFFKAGPDLQLTQLPLAQASQLLPQLLPIPEPPPGQIRSEAVKDGVYWADLEVTEATILLFKATYHPNWQAIVDGAAVEPVMVMPSYVGIPVTPGSHQVRLEYRPGPMRTILGVMGLCILPLIALVERRQGMWLAWLRPVLPVTWPGLAKRDQPDQALKSLPLVNLRTRAGLYLLFLSIYLISSAGHFFSTDHVSVYLTTQSMIERQSLAIKPINDTVIGSEGQAYGVFGLGQSILAIPFYLIGRFVEGMSSTALKDYWSGPNLDDWGGAVPIFFVSLLNQFVMPLLGILVFMFSRQLGYSARRAFAVTLMFGFGTAAWVYARDSFQHPVEALCLLVALYIFFIHRDHLQLQHMLVAGLALSLGVLTRPNMLLVMPAFIIYLIYLQLRDHGAGFALLPLERNQGTWQRVRVSIYSLWRQGLILKIGSYLLAFCLPMLLVMAFIYHVNQIRYGYYLASTGTPGEVSSLWLKFATIFADSQWRLEREGWAKPIWLGLYGNLLSPGRSIFLYSPPIILALFTWSKFYQRHRAEALLFLTIIVTYLVPYSLYGHWHGGWAWGPRLLMPLLPLVVIPTGYFLESRRRITIAILLTCLGIGIQLLGIMVNYSYIHWEWLDMGLSLENPDYLFLPAISPIPMHLQALLEQQYLDLWLLWVYQQYGLPVFLVTISVPLLILGKALTLLKDLYSTEFDGLKQ